MGGIAHVGVIDAAVCCPGIARVFPPGARTDNARGALVLDPRRTVRRSALIIFVPAVLDPLIDAAAHIEQPKRIWLQAADLDRLVGDQNVAAVLAIDHAGLKLIAPPVSGLRAAARGIFPFSF